MRISATLVDDLARTLVQRSGKDALRIVEASARSQSVASSPERARLTAEVAARLRLYIPGKGSTVDIFA